MVMDKTVRLLSFHSVRGFVLQRTYQCWGAGIRSWAFLERAEFVKKNYREPEQELEPVNKTLQMVPRSRESGSRELVLKRYRLPNTVTEYLEI